MDLDLIYKELGYTNLFKFLCRLRKDGHISISGYQLERIQRQLDRFKVNYRTLDIGYGFKIELKEE